MTVAENIRRMRKEKGLTQKQLGDLCEPKMADSTIRQYELGLRNPKIETLTKIADALDTTPSVLMEQSEKTVGGNIRRFRTRQGLSQDELARLSGLTESDINNYECEANEIDLESLKKISRALGVYIGNLDENWSRYIEDKTNFFLQDYSTPYENYIEGLKRYVKHEETLLLNDYRILNSEGRKEARKRIQELTEIQRYTQKEEE